MVFYKNWRRKIMNSKCPNGAGRVKEDCSICEQLKKDEKGSDHDEADIALIKAVQLAKYQSKPPPTESASASQPHIENKRAAPFDKINP
jgi:hypothetical protein